MSTRGRPAFSLARLRALARPVTIFTLVYFAMLVYPPLRLAGLLWPGWQPGTGALLAIIVLPIIGRIAYELRPGTASRVLAALSLSWLGLAFLLFCLLLPAELLMALLDPPRQMAGLLIGALWCALGAWSLVNAQRIGVRRLTLPAPALTRPLRLVQISDVHVGSRMGGFLARVSRRVAALEPDLVMITGDLVDFRDIPVRDLASLSTLGAPTFFCIGNHERYVDCDAICARLESLGVKVLREAVDTSLPPLVIVGLDDAESRRRVERGLDALGTLPQGYRILLYHRPDGLEDAAAAGVDLMLCGHTHNGQIIPFNFIVRRVFPRIRGLYRHGDARLHVSPGTGTWGPVMRLGTANEITVLTLDPQGREPVRAQGSAPDSRSSSSTAPAMRA